MLLKTNLELQNLAAFIIKSLQHLTPQTSHI